MIKGKQNWTVANIKKMYEDKKVLSFDHPLVNVVFKILVTWDEK